MRYSRNDLTSINEIDIDDFLWIINYVEKNTYKHGDCLLWSGRKNDNGYARVSDKIHPSIFKKCGNRLSYILFNLVDIPKYCVVERKCENKGNGCINPQHIRINNRRNYTKELRGEVHPAAIITEEQALAIKNSKNSGLTQAKRAIQYNTTVGTVQSIDRGKCWRHIFTEQELTDIDSNKVQKHRLSRNDIRKVKKYCKNHSSYETAKNTKLGISASMVRLIKRKQHHEDVCTDEESGDDEILDKWKQEHYYEEIKQRILKSIEKKEDQGEHWLWKDYTVEIGYGQIHFNKRSRAAHLVSFVVFNNLNFPLPKGSVVRHKCLYKACCNPDCLELGTQKDNINDIVRDAIKTGRLVKRRKLEHKKE